MTTVRRRNVSTVEARDNFADLLNRAAYGKERVVLARRGRPLAAVVPIEDVATLEALEDQADAEEIRARLTEWKQSGQPAVPLDAVAREHGVSLRRGKRTTRRESKK